jgi:glycosyltransferase involved in cell wall biosynthesis
MRRVLFLAYLFPPIANSGTQRPLKFAKYLPTYGWEPTVITADRFDDHQVDNSLLDEVAPGQRIVRVPRLDQRIADAIAAVTFHTRFGINLSEALSWRLRDLFQTPDLYAPWKPTALRAALRVFRESGFDAIYATGFPWTTLIIGRDLAHATGRPLIADFRDPWAGESLWRPPRASAQTELQLERTVIEKAAAVLAVSWSMTETMRAAHPGVDQSKFVTITNGFDRADLAAPPPTRNDKFRIVYTGVWKDGYNPARLYDAIKQMLRSSPHVLDKVEVIMAGFEPGEARRRGLDSHVSELGRLSHQDALALMYSADVLFFANADRSYQRLALPGKMYEYLATGRPVLAVADPDGDVARVFTLVGGGRVISPSDDDTLAQVLTRACLARKLEVPPLDDDALSAFERPNLAKRLARVLDAVHDGGSLPQDEPWRPLHDRKEAGIHTAAALSVSPRDETRNS